MKSIAIFASGNGTNFDALQQAFLDNPHINIACMVCDHANAPVVGKAQRAGVPVITVNYRDYANKAAAEQAIIDALPPVDLVVLAGFMRILGPTLLGAFPRKIVNLHPALLPSFPGRTGIEDAFAYGVKVTGVTVHYVDAGVDSGEIIAQEPVRILSDDTVDTLTTRIHATEHVLLPKTVAALLQH